MNFFFIILQPSKSKTFKKKHKRLVDYELGVRLVLALAVSLYVGDALKDLVCAPRPLAMVKEEDEEKDEKKTGNGNGSRSKPRQRRPPRQGLGIRLLTADASGASERRDDEQARQNSSHNVDGRVHPAGDASQGHEQRPEHGDDPRRGDGDGETL